MSASRVVVFSAKRIHTLDANRPEATHVAVRDGKVLGVGTLMDLKGWGPHDLDERFADKVLMPGLVEGHSHLMAGSIWLYTYCGPYDTPDPDGRIAIGLKSKEAVLHHLRQQAGTGEPKSAITGWGLDPLLIGADRLTRHDLDAVSTTRPVGVLHASGHLLYANSKALEGANLLRTGMTHPGIPLGPDGLPSGELRGPDVMVRLMGTFGLDRVFLGSQEFGIRALGRLAVRAGVTTATDLGAACTDDEITLLQRVTADDHYPLRLVSALRTIGLRPADAVDRAVQLRALSTEKLRLGMLKIIADGSIQGFTARLRWPGYYNGEPNGLWYTAPEAVREMCTLALRKGIQVHVHTNGDEAVDMVLDTMDAALAECPSRDHRFTLQHCQMADEAQFRRMQALGVCANLFINHIFYWGEAHRATTIGPDRAARMNACRTAQECGVTYSLHSDAPITPMAPLFSAWCAIERRTSTGHTLGERQRISVQQALHAVTLGAARTLKLDHEIGSIACGKKADFCVLEDNPFTVAPERIKDVPVWGTVLGGRPFQAAVSATKQ